MTFAALLRSVQAGSCKIWFQRDNSFDSAKYLINTIILSDEPRVVEEKAAQNAEMAEYGAGQY